MGSVSGNTIAPKGQRHSQGHGDPSPMLATAPGDGPILPDSVNIVLDLTCPPPQKNGTTCHKQHNCLQSVTKAEVSQFLQRRIELHLSGKGLQGRTIISATLY